LAGALRVIDRIIHATSRYMLGNVVISVICGTVYGVTALILGLPYRSRWRLSSRSSTTFPTSGRRSLASSSGSSHSRAAADRSIASSI
jgi:hypothetical protein